LNSILYIDLPKKIVNVRQKENNIILYAIKDKAHIKSGRLVTAYDEALYGYKPEVHALAEFEDIEFLAFPKGRRKQTKLQHEIHKSYFETKVIRNNLINNNLINSLGNRMIKTHYNFLSHFAHPTMENLEIWQKCSKDLFLIQNIKGYEDEDCRRLVLLYVAKFMQMFMQLVVKHYKRGNPKFKPQKYVSLIEELKDMSKDLWFIGDQPMKFDRRRWEALKATFSDKIKENEKPRDIQYYRNPLQRVEEMRKSRW